MKKWVILLSYLAVLLIGFLNRDYIIEWIGNRDPSYLPAVFLLSALFATIPIIPFTIYAGLMGAKYGIVIGMAINWFGATSAAVFYFWLARYLMRDFFNRYIKRFEGVQKLNDMIEKNAFIAILIGRMVPIVPPPMMNIYPALNNIPFSTYFKASAIGKIPPMFIMAYGGAQIFSSMKNFLIGIFLYFLFVLCVFWVYRKGKPA